MMMPIKSLSSIIFLIMGLLTAFAAGAGAMYFWLLGRVPPQTTLPTNWKIYKNEAQNFEIRYPENLITMTTKAKQVLLTHSVPFPHTDPCDFREGTGRLESLTDFNLALEVVPENLKGALMANHDEYLIDYLEDNHLKVQAGFIEEFKKGNLAGYKIWNSVEGCGGYKYYFPLNLENTLVINRILPTEFNQIILNYQDNLKLPGIIKPEEEEKLFNQILTTFKFSKTSAEGKFCGGFAGTPCPEGYKCQLDGNYPDAGGKCFLNYNNFYNSGQGEVISNSFFFLFNSCHKTSVM